MSLLIIDKIDKRYDNDSHALVNFSLSIEQGSIWSLVGESGSGKSTLLRIIAGLETQDSGQVYFKGERILNPKEKLLPGYEEIQLIHQYHELYPHSTTEENIARPLLRFNHKYKAQRLEFLLELLGLEPHRHKLPRELSGGQQQKVAIARALSSEPEVLLLDEPFSSLDNIQKRELINELQSIFQQLNVTVLLVTHDIDDAMMMTDKICIIEKGQIVQRGNSGFIHQNPKSYYVAKLLSELNPIPGQEGAFIRPADIVTAKSSPGLKAIVRDVRYLVAYNHLSVSVEGSSRVWSLEDRKREYKKGDPLFLRWDQKKALVLK